MIFGKLLLLLLVIMCTGMVKLTNGRLEKNTSIIKYVPQEVHTNMLDKNSTRVFNLKKSVERVQSRASPGVSYHEFLINEASYKFWAIFQLVTVVVLLYSTFAAIYYARYNYLQNLESGQYDDLLFRSLSDRYLHFPKFNVQTFQRIVDSTSGD